MLISKDLCNIKSAHDEDDHAAVLSLHPEWQDATMTATVTSSPDLIFEANPYGTYQSLSPLEADVLWEYAKLSQHVKEVCYPHFVLAVQCLSDTT